MPNETDATVEIKSLSVEELKPNPWNRTQFDADAMNDLTASIKTVGIKEPLIVRPMPEGGYQIASGHRRWLAAKAAGLQVVPCWVQALPDDQVAEDNIIINIQREDLPPLEMARMVDGYMKQFTKTQQQAAEKFGKSLDWVKGLVGFLVIEPELLEKCNALHLSWASLRAMKATSPDVQKQIAQEIGEGKLKAESIENRCKELAGGKKQPKNPKSDAPSAPDPLGKVWAEAKYSISSKVAAHWEASFGPKKVAIGKGITLNSWTFTVSPTNQQTPERELARWLYQMTQVVAQKVGMDPSKTFEEEVMERNTEFNAQIAKLPGMAPLHPTPEVAATPAAPAPTPQTPATAAPTPQEEPLDPKIEAMIARQLAKGKLR